MKKIFTLISYSLFFALLFNKTHAQNTFPANGAVGIGTTTPNTSSLLEIRSTAKGFLMPRMTLAQRNAITLPATGLLIYQTNSTTGFYYYTGGGWKAVTPPGGWLLTGNSGTDSSLNFIGTKDAHPLAIRVNNKKAGWIDFTGNNNTSFGYQALLTNTTGANNAAFGFGALKSNISGGNNTAFGASALFNNGIGANVNLDEGTRNTAIGASSMFSNTTGLYNTALGVSSLYANTSGFFNTAIGLDALESNTDGHDNTATGLAALDANTHGSYNTSSGSRSMTLNTSGSNNTASGFASLHDNTTGYSNVAIGTWSLYKNTNAHNLVAVGDSALYNNGVNAINSYEATGNTAIGSKALYSNTTGYYNTANGYGALYSNSTGYGNTANGYDALYFNTNGTYNTANGYNALSLNSSGSGNTASGYNALHFNSSGYSNVAIGINALYNNTTMHNNVAIGDSALYNNGILAAFFEATDNTAIGSKALFSNTTGWENTAIGSGALFSNTEGFLNTAIGWRALNSATTGAAGNTAIGGEALNFNATGDRITALGYDADVTGQNLLNATALGYGAKVNANYKVRIGNEQVTVVESQVGSWTTSDGRFKNNIKENVKGLEFIKLLRPVTYNFNTQKFSEFLMQNYPDSIKKKRLAAMDKEATAKASAIMQSGFVAQEVEEAVKKSGYNFNGVHVPENPTDNWSLSYEKLTVPLVKAVQELSKMNDEKDSIIEMQNNKIDDLENRLTKIESILNASSGNNKLQIENISPASLQQNVPNPFNHTTTINYSLPQKFTTAQIIITDKLGNTLKAINVSGSGKGSLNVDATTLAAGAYNYSLIVDGKIIATKQMVLTR